MSKKTLTLRELIYFHFQSHIEDIPSLHDNIVDELLERGYTHLNTELNKEIVPYGEIVNKDDIEDVEYISLNNLVNQLPVNISLREEPYFCYLSGDIRGDEISKSGTMNFIFTQKPDKRLITVIKSLEYKLPCEVYVSFSKSIPIDAIPIFRYGLFKTSKEEMGNISKSELKYKKYKISDFNNLYYNWISDKLHNGLFISESYNSKVFSINKRKDNISINIDGNDRTKYYPNVVKELSGIEGEYVIKGNISVYNTMGKEVNSSLLKKSCDKISMENSKWISNGSITPEQESCIVFHTHNLTYLGECISNKPYRERYKKLIKLIPENLKFIDVVKHIEVNNYKELNENINNLIKSGCEEIILTVSDSIFPSKKSDIVKVILNDTLSPIEFKECLYSKDENICSFISNLSRNCSLSNIYKCIFK